MENATQETWLDVLKKRLPYYGHRNWILVVDAAYPMQVSEGIEIVLASGTVPEVAAQVLNEIVKRPHIRSVVYADAELQFTFHWNGLEKHPEMAGATFLPHEELLKKVSEAGQNYRIFVIKTDTIQAYTSLFIELDCGYWSAQQEKELRERMERETTQ